MPLKWKIFYALNFVLSIPSFVCLLFLLINFFNNHVRQTNYTIAILSLCGFFMITVNGFLNIYTLQRFFPDKLLPAGLKTINILSLILNIVISIALLIITIAGAIDEFGDSYYYRDSTGRIIVIALFFFWGVQVVVLIMQGVLPAAISHNHRESIHSLIDSIGQ